MSIAIAAESEIVLTNGATVLMSVVRKGREGERDQLGVVLARTAQDFVVWGIGTDERTPGRFDAFHGDYIYRLADELGAFEAAQAIFQERAQRCLAGAR
jgi:hypothetical protein